MGICQFDKEWERQSFQKEMKMYVKPWNEKTLYSQLGPEYVLRNRQW